MLGAPVAGEFWRGGGLARRGRGLTTIDDARLLALPVSAAGRVAIGCLLADQRLLRERALDPQLNCLHGYPRDEAAGPVAADVFSFHADSAPVAATDQIRPGVFSFSKRRGY